MGTLLIHSDQGTQFGSDAWRRFCRSNGLEPSMSRKGNCWDSAVADVADYINLAAVVLDEVDERHIAAHEMDELAHADRAATRALGGDSVVQADVD